MTDLPQMLTLLEWTNAPRFGGNYVLLVYGEKIAIVLFLGNVKQKAVWLC